MRNNLYLQYIYLVVALTHAIYPKLAPLLRARRKTESHAIAKTHTTNSKSHCARLIQHIHWHHQTLTKPCAHGVKHKESSFQLSHQRKQITLCTAHSAHQPLTSPSLNRTMRTLCRTPQKVIPILTPTRSERDGNEIQALHLATFPFFCPNHKSLVKTRFTTFLNFAHPYLLSSNSFSSSLLLFSSLLVLCPYCRLFGS